MARYRKRPKACTDPGPCRGGECGKCAYNRRSGYPVFHWSPFKPTPGCVGDGFDAGPPLLYLLVVVWWSVVVSFWGPPRSLDANHVPSTVQQPTTWPGQHGAYPKWSDLPHEPVAKSSHHR